MSWKGEVGGTDETDIGNLYLPILLELVGHFKLGERMKLMDSNSNRGSINRPTAMNVGDFDDRARMVEGRHDGGRI